MYMIWSNSIEQIKEDGFSHEISEKVGLNSYLSYAHSLNVHCPKSNMMG